MEIAPGDTVQNLKSPGLSGRVDSADYAQFYCLDLDLWLANFEICLIFCLGGLGSCSRTVTICFLSYFSHNLLDIYP